MNVPPIPRAIPTHGVIIGSDFYYIANSGWDIIDALGKQGVAGEK